MLDRMLLSAGGEEKLYVEDVFSTYLYTGNGSTQTITNGVDLAGKGGMVWTKNRGRGTSANIIDTIRGVTKKVVPSSTGAQATVSYMTSFDTTGYTINGNNDEMNLSADTYASWTFRKAPKFFDVVTYTGNGSSSQVQNHSLGTTPGMIIVKHTSGSGENWVVWHRSLASSNLLYLNTTDAAFVDNGTRIKAADATTFTVGLNGSTGGNGGTYVAYLFAHDATADGIIQCGSYTGNGSATGPTVTLGWEPQWLLVKDATTASYDWRLVDNMRGMPVGSGAPSLFPNLSNAEFTSSLIGFNPTATGFEVAGSHASTNANGSTYIYVAIRRGPMRTPTSGTSVFSPNTTTSAYGQTVTINFAADLVVSLYRDGGVTYSQVFDDRLRGFRSSLASNPQVALFSTLDNPEANAGYVENVNNTSWRTYSGSGYTNTVSYSLRRAPGFFDEVCYTGTGAARTVNHNLGVAPELIITKARASSSAAQWYVHHTFTSTNFKEQYLQDIAKQYSDNYGVVYSASPTATGYSIVDGVTNGSGTTYVAYLFASCPGVSKVFSFTGNGSSQTINCGFSGGARFVMIKRTDSAGDWYVWDTARGLVTGNDPHLSLNTTAAEVTTDDTIDPDSTGFIVNQVSATNVNVSGASYIGLAVA